MRRMRKLLQLLMLVFICYSCEESRLEEANQGKSEISIDLPEDLSEVFFTKEGGQQTILLTANNRWLANVSNIEDEQWVTINLTEGNAGEDQEIVITTLENTEKKNRESEIIFVCGNSPMKVAIKQAQQSDIIIPEDQKELIFTEATPMVVLIDSNVDIEVEIATELPAQQQWLFCVPTPTVAPTTKGLKQKSFTITTTTNYGDQRKGEVIFKNAETGDRSVINITQAKENAVFIRSEDEHELKYNGTTPIEVLIDANAEIATTITYSTQDATPQEGWLTVAPVTSLSKALVAKTFSFTATENPLSTDRTATIRFANTTDQTVYDEITVKQLRKGTIVIDNPTHIIDKKLQDYKVTVKSTDIEGINVVISDITEGADAWITYDANVPPAAVEDEEGAYIYTFQVKLNELTDTRSAKITFGDINDANISDLVTVSQLGKGSINITNPSTATATITNILQDYEITVTSTEVDEIDVVIEIPTGADSEWISYNKAVAPIDGVYIFQVKQNGLTQRTAKIIFKDKNDATISETLTLTQEKSEKGNIQITTPADPTADITGELQDYQVTLTSTDVEGINVIISDITVGADAQWITYDASTTLGNSVYKFQAKQNTDAPRSATIIFKDINDDTVSDAITVTQAVKVDQLNIELISPNSNWDQTTNNPINANPFAATEYKFQITTDKEWSVRGNNDVLVTVDKSGNSAATNQEITVTIPVNTASSSSAQRAVTLTFTSGNSTIDVKIIQKDSKVNVAYNSGDGTLEAAIKSVSAYYSQTTITDLTITGTKVLNSADFTYMRGITTLTDLDISASKVPSSEMIIPAGAFKNHPNLARVKLYTSLVGADIRVIGASAFENCTKLESIDLNIVGLTTLGHSAFFGCAALTNITLPTTMTNLGQKTFRQCTGLQSIIIHGITPPIISNHSSNGTLHNGGITKPWFYVPDSALTAYMSTENGDNNGWNHAKYKSRIKSLNTYPNK